MQIIGGVVSYEDGIKTTQGDQFSPTRKVRVELNFSLNAGDANGSSDTAIQTVLDKAQAFVQGKLGLAAPTAAATSTKSTEAGKSAEKKSDGAPKTPRAPRAPAQKAGEVGNASAGTPSAQVDLEDLTGAAQGNAGAQTEGKTKADLAKAAGLDVEIAGKGNVNLGDDLAAAPTKTNGASVPATVPAADPNDLSDLMGSTAPAEKLITDADLNDLAQKTMQRINTAENPGGPRIRALVKEYLPEGSQPVLIKVPADKRHDLKAKLEALK